MANVGAFTCIHEHGMPAYGCLDGNASFGEQLTQVLHLADAGLEVVEAEYFLSPLDMASKSLPANPP